MERLTPPCSQNLAPKKGNAMSQGLRDTNTLELRVSPPCHHHETLHTDMGKGSDGMERQALASCPQHAHLIASSSSSGEGMEQLFSCC